MTTQLDPDLLDSLGQRIDGDTARWWTRDLSGSYPWFRARALMWFIGSSYGSAVVARDFDDEFYLVDTPAGRVKLADSMAASFGNRPWDYQGAEKFCASLIDLLRDPRYRVATPAWFQRQRVVLDSWLMGSEKNPAALERLCSEPELRLHADGWTMTFNAVDYNGGVAAWQAEGSFDPFRIASLSSQPRRAAGTFSYPEEL